MAHDHILAQFVSFQAYVFTPGLDTVALIRSNLTISDYLLVFKLAPQLVPDAAVDA